MGLRLSRFRRVLAALFAAAGTAFALLTLRPGQAAGEEILVASRDLPAGATLRPADLRTVTVPSAAVPSGALDGLRQGRVLTGPMRRGEPLTDVRVVSSRLLDGYGPGTVATPVRIADADSVRLLRPGDRVDILARSAAHDVPPEVSPQPSGAPGVRLVVASVPVIAVPRSSPGAQGALVVVATGRAQAAALAGAGAGLALSITGG